LFGDEEPEDDDVERFMEDSMFGPEESFFGHKDDDMEPFGAFGGLFDQLNSQFGNMMSSLPQLDNLREMLPFGEKSGGKLTVIKAGPGFHEEKSYNIGPDGEITEVKPVEMVDDALEHENPMDTHFDSADVEMIHTAADVKKVEAAPVMDVRGLEEQEPEKSSQEPLVSVEEFQEHDLPYLSVLRNSVEEKARVLSEKILEKYRSMAEREYLDNECSSKNLSWSDWVSCLHAKVGVPRWLTAATISLGIIFSIWLCLVIPSTAPKRKVKTLLIKGEKPSAAILKAVKEAEAAAAKAKEAEASGFKKEDYMVAVINVDLPPTYGDVAVPGSPAPSYKSDMAPVPASPAPSYKSMDVPATSVALEPVHEKKESTA